MAQPLLQGYGTPTVVVQGLGPAAPPEPPAPTLLAAIRARADSDPTLAALLPGGVTYGLADRDPVSPYAVIYEVGYSTSRTTGRPYGRETLFQVNFYGNDPDALKLCLDAWEDAFRPGMAPLRVEGQQVYACDTTGGLLAHNEAYAENGLPLFLQTAEMLAGVVRLSPA